jgi:hypothetical protein
MRLLHKIALLGWLTLATMAAYVALDRTVPDCFSRSDPSPLDVFHLSLAMATSVGNEDLKPRHTLARVLMWLQICLAVAVSMS